jgi:hypothetical protein
MYQVSGFARQKTAVFEDADTDSGSTGTAPGHTTLWKQAAGRTGSGRHLVDDTYERLGDATSTASLHLAGAHHL